MPARTVRLGALNPAHDWTDYTIGAIWALERRGLRCPGFTCEVTSDVPVGAGLSSSAALELAVLRALREAFGFALSDRDLAMVAHEAETGFVGARVGQMDQLVCSLGRDGAS